MGEVSTIDIATSVLQVDGVDDSGCVVVRKRISRAKMLEFFAATAPVNRSLPSSTQIDAFL
jgi:hypothetical protein